MNFNAEVKLTAAFYKTGFRAPASRVQVPVLFCSALHSPSLLSSRGANVQIFQTAFAVENMLSIGYYCSIKRRYSVEQNKEVLGGLIFSSNCWQPVFACSIKVRHSVHFISCVLSFETHPHNITDKQSFCQSHKRNKHLNDLESMCCKMLKAKECCHFVRFIY